jgi:hypothetical protein
MPFQTLKAAHHYQPGWLDGCQPPRSEYGEGGMRKVTSTVIATTRSGSRYVILVERDGARWIRLPHSARSQPMVGWLDSPPRVVSGERLMLGDIQSTPVVRVSFLPGPEVRDRSIGANIDGLEGIPQASQARSLRSLFGGQRH